MNFLRIINLKTEIKINAFFVMAHILKVYFPAKKYKTSNIRLNEIERTLRNNEYGAFESYIIVNFL